MKLMERLKLNNSKINQIKCMETTYRCMEKPTLEKLEKSITCQSHLFFMYENPLFLRLFYPNKTKALDIIFKNV